MDSFTKKEIKLFKKIQKKVFRSASFWTNGHIIDMDHNFGGISISADNDSYIIELYYVVKSGPKSGPGSTKYIDAMIVKRPLVNLNKFLSEINNKIDIIFEKYHDS